MSRFERVERGFIPLRQLEAESSRVRVALNLSDYVPTDKIGVNVNRMYSMMKMGGISTVTLVGASGEVDNATPSIVGGNQEAAYAGNRTIVKKAKSFTSERIDQEVTSEPDYLAGRWSDATITINLSDLQDKLSKKGQLRSAKAWSRELDKAIRKGITKEGQRHLIADGNAADYTAMAVSTSLGAYLGEIVLQNSLLGVIYSHAGLNIKNRMNYARNNYDTDGFRWSVFSGQQLDRAGILWGMSKVGKTVKALSEQK